MQKREMVSLYFVWLSDVTTFFLSLVLNGYSRTKFSCCIVFNYVRKKRKKEKSLVVRWVIYSSIQLIPQSHSYTTVSENTSSAFAFSRAVSSPRTLPGQLEAAAKGWNTWPGRVNHESLRPRPGSKIQFFSRPFSCSRSRTGGVIFVFQRRSLSPLAPRYNSSYLRRVVRASSSFSPSLSCSLPRLMNDGRAEAGCRPAPRRLGFRRGWRRPGARRPESLF